MLSKLAAFALLPLLAVAAFVVAYFVFYGGGYEPPPAPAVTFDHIGSTTIPPRESADLPTGQLRQGLLVVDAQHGNSFSEKELVNFASKVSDRGFEVEFLRDFTPFPDPTQVQVRLAQLSEKLRRADAFAVILPQVAYSEHEAAVVERFVDMGGKLLLVSDPGRPHSINALAKRFGVDFQADYLYNTVEYDANFKRILIREFQPDQLTAGLNVITLDYTGSVQSSGSGLAFAPPSTESSLLSTVEVLSPMAWGDSRNVLAIADFGFMVPNNDSLLDNGRLVSNIADYITEDRQGVPPVRLSAFLRQRSRGKRGHSHKQGRPAEHRPADQDPPQLPAYIIGDHLGGGREQGHPFPRPLRGRITGESISGGCRSVGG